MVGALPTFHCLLGSACLVAGGMVGCDAGGCHASLVDLVLRSGLRKVVLIRPHLRIGLAARSPHSLRIGLLSVARTAGIGSAQSYTVQKAAHRGPHRSFRRPNLGFVGGCVALLGDLQEAVAGELVEPSAGLILFVFGGL